MSEFRIRKIAVLGAGVMGAQIAAHCVNAGIEVLLYDLAAKEGPSNSLVNKAIEHLKKMSPTPLATAETTLFLQAKNYEKNIEELSECDLVIEAIAERLDWKEKLYERIIPYIHPQALLVSNTSGLSVNTLANTLQQHLQSRFCGLHFFNPPRYMYLAELIPTEKTDPDVLNFLETWLTSDLGKGVVRAKDTPNFIANRIGVFSLLAIIKQAETLGLGLDEVDAITGSLLGRPKSATFRTMDIVGLDTMQHVVNTMLDQLKTDPWHSLFQMPEWLLNLIQEGHLGQKSGQGIYRKQGKVIEVYDLKTRAYRAAQGKISAELQDIMKNRDLSQRMRSLFASEDPQAQFLSGYFRELFHYCAYHLEHIANNVRDVDFALRWGFGWQQGPFELWQLADFKNMLLEIETNSNQPQAKLPNWIYEIEQFYNEVGAFSPQTNRFVPRSSLPVYKKQFFPEPVLNELSITPKILYENEGVQLWHLQDEVAVVQFKSKANTLGQAVLDGMEKAIDIAEKEYQGLIIYQKDANNFSSGADLRGVAECLQSNKMRALEEMIEQFQRMVMRIKYATVPVIAALRGRALGGGCELLLHCTRIASAFESYPGLVEAGVGLIPAGGGCKEMALRAAFQAQNEDVFTPLSRYFERIAKAQVAGSAVEAQQWNYLKATDNWVMNSHEVLNLALAHIKLLQASNYHPSVKPKIKVAGREGHARIKAGLVNWLEGGFISQHDFFLTDRLAYVLCGGDSNQGTLVDEEWLLKLEKQAFMELASTPLSQARIAHLLETGKPLRN